MSAPWTDIATEAVAIAQEIKRLETAGAQLLAQFQRDFQQVEVHIMPTNQSYGWAQFKDGWKVSVSHATPLEDSLAIPNEAKLVELAERILNAARRRQSIVGGGSQ